jgi:hypothetical protein
VTAWGLHDGESSRSAQVGIEASDVNTADRRGVRRTRLDGSAHGWFRVGPHATIIWGGNSCVSVVWQVVAAKASPECRRVPPTAIAVH